MSKMLIDMVYFFTGVNRLCQFYLLLMVLDRVRCCCWMGDQTIANAINAKNVSVYMCGVSTNEQMVPLINIKIGFKNNTSKRGIYQPICLCYMKEKERYLQPCPAHVPAHDPRKLLYCIYVRLQPQINLLALSSECSSGKVQLSSRFVSFWMMVNPQ